MKEYHKIQTVFKRDPTTNRKTLLEGQYSMPELEYLKDNVWVFTEKVDGTNIRVKHENNIVSFGGKTDNSQIPTFLYDRLYELFQNGKMYGTFNASDACLYGEGYGAKIQKGGGNYIKDGVDFVLFDVRIGEWWLKREDVKEIAAKLGIYVVPVIGEGSLLDGVEVVRSGFDSTWGEFPAEGLVMRPKTELRARSGQRIITKIKHKDFRRDKKMD